MEQQQKIVVNLVSFGFKYGEPSSVNFIWDVRFLPNPYWQEELRSLTGLEHDVSDFVVASSAGHNFINLMKPLLLYLVQQNISASKEEITIAVGCTGGRHRSVAMVEVFKDILQMMPVTLAVSHRDIDKDS